jgi:hypothetical protein
MRVFATILCSIALLGGVHVPRGAPLGGAIDVTVVALPGGASIQAAGDAAAIAELGTVSSNLRYTSPGVQIVRRPHSYVVLTWVGLRATSQNVPGPVDLQGFLEEPLAGGATVRVDGVRLTSFPQTFATRVQLGVVTRHRIELEIPNTTSTGAVPSEIPLEFGANPE